MSNNETLADILDEMRSDEAASVLTTGLLAHEMKQQLNFWADRIEAAAERERGALVAEAEAAKDARNRVAVRLGVEYAERCRECREKSGNAARAALEAVAENLAIHIQCGRFVAPGDHVSFPISEAEAYIRDIRAALAAPPRNCDVGTAEVKIEGGAE